MLLVLLLLAVSPGFPKPPTLQNPCAKNELPFLGKCKDQKSVQEFVKKLDGWRKSCANGKADDCVPLAEAYRDGALVPHSPEYSVSLLSYACEGKSARACALLASFYRTGLGTQADKTKGADALQHACDLKDATSCNRLGEFYEKGGEGVDHDTKKAIALYERACTLGDKAGCDNYGLMHYGADSAPKH